MAEEAELSVSRCVLTWMPLVVFFFSALLADGNRLRSGLSGGLRHGVDGEGLGAGQEPPGVTG